MLTQKQRDEVIGLAINDARIHQDEFPGEKIKGDWDSESFAESIKLTELADADLEEAWECYRKYLHLAVANWPNDID